jgi:hypothetical protein
MTAAVTTSAQFGDIELASLERSPTEKLVVTWALFEGHRYLSLRVFFRAPDGRWLPTKKGCSVKLRELWDVSDALTKAIELTKAQRR